METDDWLPKVRTHVGLIVQADDLELVRDLVRYVIAYIERTPGLRLVHKDVSADKLWLKRGGDGP